MNKQPEALRLAKSEALRLADELQAVSKNPWAKHWERCLEAAAELHRLHALNVELLEALQACEARLTHLAQNSVNVVAELKQARAAIAKAEGGQP